MVRGPDGSGMSRGRSTGLLKGDGADNGLIEGESVLVKKRVPYERLVCIHMRYLRVRRRLTVAMLPQWMG